MKISKEEKQATARRIVEAGAELIGKQGFEQTSMRQIAQAANVGEATIYRYYPSKYALIFGYYDNLHDRVIERLQLVKGFEQFSFTEQIQVMIYTELDLLAPQKAFVKESYQTILRGGFMQATDEAFALRKRGSEMIEELIDAAIDAGEFDEPPFKNAIGGSILDLFVGVVYYWQADESKNHENTMQLVDKALVLVDSLLKSNILGNVVDIFQFLFRQHIVSQLTKPTARNINFDEIKKQFMGATP